MTDAIDKGKLEAARLATILHKKYYSDVIHWELLDTTEGIISQIDNMTAGIGLRIDDLTAERDAWIESAAKLDGDTKFYQGLVRQIGELFGEAAKTSEDGSIQQDVLALKVPELVEALVAERDALKAENEHLESRLATLTGRIESPQDKG